MKAYFTKFTISLLVFFIFLSCNREEIDTQKSPCLSIEEIGRKHNEILEQVSTQITIEDEDEIEELTIKEAHLINRYLTSNNLTFKSVNTIDIATSTNNTYIAHKSIAARTQTIAEKLRDQINDLNKENLITSTESILLEKLITLIEDADTNGDYSDFKVRLNDLQDQWASANFSTSKNEGYISGLTLAVAENSYNYWTNENTVANGKTQAVPLWVGLDAVGALAGAGGSLWSQRNNEKVDWWEVGGQALIWGAAGSIPGTRAFSKIVR